MCKETSDISFGRFIIKAQLLLLLCFMGTAQAAQTYTPSNVFSGVEYSNRIVDKLLAANSINSIQLPQSREKSAKPMHVYELHVAVLMELYGYALTNNRRPPPLVASTPIKYTPTDVYYLTQLVMRNLEGIYADSGNPFDVAMASHSNKSPADVYQELFKLYYKLNLLNGKSKVSPNEVYAHIYRAKEDLQNNLLIMSKRMDEADEEKKRLLVTAIYGMHPDGTVISPMGQGKKPADVIAKSMEVRAQLNAFRKRNSLKEIDVPTMSEFAAAKPIDAFLQTQFIIAEINLLKISLGIYSSTSSPKPVIGKTPSDVYQEMKHVEYMLDRLMNVL